MLTDLINRNRREIEVDLNRPAATLANAQIDKSEQNVMKMKGCQQSFRVDSGRMDTLVTSNLG